MADRKRNISVPDSLWGRLATQQRRHRRSLAGEVRVALEVYVLLSEADSPVIEEVLDSASGVAVGSAR